MYLQQESLINSTNNVLSLINNIPFTETTTSGCVIQGSNKFNSHLSRHKFINKHHKKSENNSTRKRIKLDSAKAEKFGRAFGIA
jgi:hypothetical protein